MKETETLDFFLKTMYSLKCNKVLNASVPEGVVEIHINPEDEEALQKINLTAKMMNEASSLMISDISTHLRGLLNARGSRGSSRSWIPRF